MENVKRLIKFIVICLASICLADDSLCDKAYDNGYQIKAPLSFSLERTDCSFSVSDLQCCIPRNTSYSPSIRISFQTQRQNTTNYTRNGYTLIKAGKSMNEYSTSLFRKSIVSFPSGINESSHRLIVLGKLII